MVQLKTIDEGGSACPSCGVVSTSLKGRATTRPRDLLYGDDPVRLVWCKRRWCCRERLCERATFVAHVSDVLAQTLPAVEVLGIDETRRGRHRWAQDPVTGRWSVVADRWGTTIVDAQGVAGLLAGLLKV